VHLLDFRQVLLDLVPVPSGMGLIAGLLGLLWLLGINHGLHLEGKLNFVFLMQWLAGLAMIRRPVGNSGGFVDLHIGRVRGVIRRPVSDFGRLVSCLVRGPADLIGSYVSRTRGLIGCFVAGADCIVRRVILR
jgi:hypothetical protein